MTMERTNNLLEIVGFDAEAIKHYNQTTAIDFCEASGIDFDNEIINWEGCDEVSLDRLGDLALNHNGVHDMREYLMTYCGECSLKQAEDMKKIFTALLGE